MVYVKLPWFLNSFIGESRDLGSWVKDKLRKNSHPLKRKAWGEPLEYADRFAFQNSPGMKTDVDCI